MEERPVAEFGQRLDHAAAGAEKLAALVRDDDLGALAAGQVAFDLVGEMVHVHDCALDPLRGEAIEHVIDQRLAADRNERLGHMPVERPHARAQPRRQHHGVFGRGRGFWGFGHQGVLRVRGLNCI